MSWNNIRLDKADTAFSRYLRLTRKACEYCGRKGIGNDGITGLQAVHDFHIVRQELKELEKDDFSEGVSL